MSKREASSELIGRGWRMGGCAGTGSRGRGEANRLRLEGRRRRCLRIDATWPCWAIAYIFSTTSARSSSVLHATTMSSSSSSPFLDVDPQSSTFAISSRPDFFSRRQSYAASVRPLRSSPLAGPSLALSQEGILVGPASDEDELASASLSSCQWSAGVSSSACTSSSVSEHGVRSRYRPSRMATSPPPSSTAKSVSAPSSIRFIQPSPAIPEVDPPSPVPRKPSRRISLGLTKLKSMPSLPSASAPLPLPTQPEYEPSPELTPPSTPGPAPSVSQRPRSILISPANSTLSLAAAAPGPTSPASTLASSTRRTPSSTSSQGSAHPHRRSYFANLPPSTSRDPELNWMSSAGPPPFSRQGLRDAGVVLPVSARDARRRSLPPAPYSPAAVARERRQTLALGHPSLVASAEAVRARVPPVRVPTASAPSTSTSISPMLAPTPVPTPTPTPTPTPAGQGSPGVLEPPAAPFTYDSPGSSTTTLSSGSRVGSSTSLSTLSRTASEASAGKGCAAGGVVVQVDGVPVAVAAGAGAGEDEGAKKGRGRGTIRRMWRRVVRSVSGR
ncbi:hypothetical protein B0H21DRAFT_67318 [Amylocystis lapponica]|nr:hypothetical protein B0H21DRAFT_67318 [Amylocystis lapponica]